MNKKEIIELRKRNISYDKAKLLQQKLINIYQKEYKPKHNSNTYLKLILNWNVSEIKEKHPQDSNYTNTVFECFSVVSQHVRGYTKEHCLDQIFDAVQRKQQRVKEYKKLSTLEELINSNIKINSKKMYYTKEKGTLEDSCDGHSGAIIREMRKTGLKKYRDKNFKKFLKSLHE